MKKTILWLGVLAMVASGAVYGQPVLQETKDGSPPMGTGNGVPPSGPCGPDAYGYTCDDTVPFQLIDVTGTGAFIVSGDDTSGVVALGGAGMFQHYGVTYTSLTAATNSYVSTDPTDGGPDLSNDCPLPATPSTGGGARLYPLHDDTLADIYYEYFASCPRPADRGGDTGCHVFTYDNVTHFGGGGPWMQEVVIYEATSDFVFQIGPGNPEQGSGSTTGTQNAAATIGLTYACNTAASIPDNTAVAFYNPDAVIPTMGEWALILFALVLLAIGALSLRSVRRNEAV